MSYEAWGEPDDDGSEQFLEAGWWPPDEIEELRALLRLVEFQTRPGNLSDAALILIDYKLNFPGSDVPEDPHAQWARILLKDAL